MQYLKQYNSRWFVFGLHSEYEIPNWNLALDRIESLNEVGNKYQHIDIDWEDYFSDIIGVTRPKDKVFEEVKLEFSSEVAPYIITKPIHPSQKHTKSDTGLLVRIKVIPNFELERLILSFGEQVKVLAPQSFKERINHRLNSAIRL